MNPVSTELLVKDTIELRAYLFELMDKYGIDGTQQIINEYETQSLLLESKLRQDFKRGYVETGEMYLDPGSFCRKCSNLWAKDSYCTNCGEKK
jgi:hypothetical protein